MTDKEKIDYLVDYVITEDEICLMALKNNWNKEKLTIIYEIMDKYLLKDDYEYTDIENDFDKKLNMNYQDLKPLFIYFYKNSKYEKVIAKYLETNFRSYDNVSSEFDEIFKKYKKRGLIRI